MKKDEIEILFGTAEPQIKPHVPYAEEILSFLDDLSKEIFQDPEAKSYPDIITFGFWIRRANMVSLQKKSNISEMRLGKGLIFHIAPSNVAINFAYTFVLGLLAGNSNIVRISSKNFIQTEIICKILNKLAMRQTFYWVAEQNGIVSYGRQNEEWNRHFSKNCHMRVIWGGNKTISELRRFPLPPRSGEITFADRYSFGILSAAAILEVSDEERRAVAERFYNDTYLMDQNACSAPHLICWLGEDEIIRKASEKFWDAVYGVSLKYDLADIKVSEKYTMLCEYGARMEGIHIRCYGNYLYVIRLDHLPEDITDLRGKYGLFFEYGIQEAGEVLDKAAEKVQTCAVFGLDPKALADHLIQNHVLGIDRVVPVGQTLDMDVIWDGHDVVKELSRYISHT